MKNFAILISFIVATSFSMAATKEKKPEEQQKTAQQNIKKTGPVGIGALKIGMTMEEISKLSASDGVYLTAPITLLDGESQGYESMLQLENLNTLKVKLRFDKSKLSSINIDLTENPSFFNTLRQKVMENYGKGIDVNDVEEKQCINYSGSAYKMEKGASHVEWRHDISESDSIFTNFTHFRAGICNFKEAFKGKIEDEWKYILIFKGKNPNSVKKSTLF